METIEYVKPLLEFDSLQIQGEAVLVNSSFPIEWLMKVLKTSITLSSEFVFEETNNQKIIIFTHLPRQALRMDEVDDFFIKNQIYKNELTGDKIETQEIDVEKYWSTYKEEKDYLKAVKKAFEDIKKEVQCAKKTTIVGPSLKLLVLLLEYYLYDKTEELVYKEFNKEIRIF